MSFQPNERLQLSWSQALTRKDPLDSDTSLAQLHGVLPHVDANGTLSIEVSNTQSQKKLQYRNIGTGATPKYQVVRYS